MLAGTVMLAMAAQGLDAFDDANLKLTACGFAAIRHANDLGQTLDQFKRSVPSRCAPEMARMRTTITAVELGRGKSAAAATASADAVIAQFSARFAADYARRAETEAQLRALEEALREEGKTNAH